MTTYEDMAGDAGYINIPDTHDGYLLIELEDLAWGHSTVYPDGAIRKVKTKEGPTVPVAVMERVQEALDADSQELAEDALDALCDFWFQLDD